ncbi:MAG: hypothetical protein FWE88_08255 [Phycisphaerae bacterium]|nr:hypothetical protein [Phycisphaerae bacterium]
MIARPHPRVAGILPACREGILPSPPTGETFRNGQSTRARRPRHEEVPR